MPRDMLLTMGGEGASALLARLEQAGVQLNAYAMAFLLDAAFAPLEQPCTLRVRLCTAAQLGLAQGGSLRTIFAAAQARGLALCPAETAVCLRLALTDQPPSGSTVLTGTHTVPDGAVTVASMPLKEDDAFPKGLYLRNVAGTPWLRGYTCTEEYQWPGESVFVFADGAGSL